MGTRERYEHGVFSYVELATSDADAARTFYGTLFGWTFEDVPQADDSASSTASLDGQRVAAIHRADQPPTWLSYVTVDDVDVTAANVEAFDGATVISGPADVSGQGRTAVVADPQGAAFALWQAKSDVGAGLVNAPGALAWNDLQTTDVAAAADFYADLLGWDIGEVEGAPDDRRGIRVGEALNGGMARIADAVASDGVRPHWLPFFGSEDVAETCERAAEAGGTVVVEPLDIPSGRMAVLVDPQGVAFGVVDGEMDP